MDDVCAQLHAVKDGADQNLKGKLRDSCLQHKYYEDSGLGFKIHHYAGRTSIPSVCYLPYVKCKYI